jgi:nucleotide-binding universal stress UspA family protein
LGVRVETAVRTHTVVEDAILRQLRGGKHNLIIMGVSPGPGTTLSLGNVPAAVLERCNHSMLFVSVQ